MVKIVEYSVTEIDGSVQRTGETNIHEVHTLIVDDDTDLGWIKRNLRPQLNWAHKDFPGYYWDTIRPKQVKRFVWEADCIATPFQLLEWVENPLDRRPVVTYDGSLVVEPTNFDTNGYPICTSAGEFIGGVERQRPIRVYHVTKNYASDPEWADAYLGAVNSDAVKIRGRVRLPGTLLLSNQNGGAYVTENQVKFFPFSFDLLWDPLGHHVERWNRGTLQLVKKTKPGTKAKYYVQEQILTPTSPRQPIAEPAFLDKRGAVIEGLLKAEENAKPLDLAKLVKLRFNVQAVLPFSGIVPLG
jgi:hypothetical protein